MTTKIAVVLLAPGFEEVEASTPIDYLRRAGIQVKVLAVGAASDLLVTGSRGLVVHAEAALEAYRETPDVVVLPGGMPGATNLASSPAVAALLQRVRDSGGIVAAICASPAVVLGPLGFLEGKRFTCFPGHEASVSQGQFSQDRVVVDGNLTTSRGPGTAAEFALEIIGQVLGDETKGKIREQVLL